VPPIVAGCHIIFSTLPEWQVGERLNSALDVICN